MLRTCIQPYAGAKSQSSALKTQHSPLGTEKSHTHSHNVNRGEKEIVTILPLLWNISLTTKICESPFKIWILYYLFGKKSGKALEIYKVPYRFILRICKASCCLRKNECRFIWSVLCRFTFVKQKKPGSYYNISPHFCCI